jgi:hypothetical protein
VLQRPQLPLDSFTQVLDREPIKMVRTRKEEMEMKSQIKSISGQEIIPLVEVEVLVRFKHTEILHQFIFYVGVIAWMVFYEILSYSSSNEVFQLF